MIILLLPASRAAAQVSPVPFVFVTGTVANPSQVNQNFASIYERALNRYGGQLKGPVTVDATGTYDLGAPTLRLRDGWFTGTLTSGPVNATTGTFSGAISATTGTFSGPITASSISGTGAALTAIPETAITDGGILARIASPEVISGAWRFQIGVTLATYTFAQLSSLTDVLVGTIVFCSNCAWDNGACAVGTGPSGALAVWAPNALGPGIPFWLCR